MNRRVAVRALSRLASIAVIALGLPACSNFHESRYLPTSPDWQNALQLTVDKPSIPADGFSTATLTARISPNASAANRTIEFTTTVGAFVGATGDGKMIESVVASDGVTSVQLRSSRTVETATVTATVKGNDEFTKQQTVTFDAVSAEDILRVFATTAPIPADGASITPITAEVAAGLPAGRREVTFTTSLGTFVADPAAPVEGDSARRTIAVEADGSNRAVAYLRSLNTELGQAVVTAKVDSTPAVSANTSVQFVRAFPTQGAGDHERPDGIGRLHGDRHHRHGHAGARRGHAHRRHYRALQGGRFGRRRSQLLLVDHPERRKRRGDRRLRLPAPGRPWASW